MFTVQIMVSEDTPIGECGRKIEFKRSHDVAQFEKLEDAEYFMRECAAACVELISED